MPVTLGAPPQADFDQPLGLLSDCHRRIEHFLDVLARVVERRQGAVLDAAHRGAVETAMEYFRKSAPRHNADEEESLFPRLRALAGSEPRIAAALEKMAELEAEHQAADDALAEVRMWFERWLEAGELAPAQVQRLGKVLAMLKSLYGRHIAIEDNDVFRLAAQVLDDRTLAEIGREMARRRGLPRHDPARAGSATGA